MAKKAQEFCVIKWNEIPPKWDVISMKSIKGEIGIGNKVLAQWSKDQYADAIVIAIGTYIYQKTYCVEIRK
jgi:hypothetical protein